MRYSQISNKKLSTLMRGADEQIANSKSYWHNSSKECLKSMSHFATQDIRSAFCHYRILHEEACLRGNFRNLTHAEIVRSLMINPDYVRERISE